MSAGFGGYRVILRDPAARAFSAAAFVARMPLSMTGLGIVLLISISTGSFGRAGLVGACQTLSSALVAPLWGRLIDRRGQALALVLTAGLFSTSLSLLVVTVMVEAPLILTVLTAVGVGLGFPPAGSCVRARWTERLRGGPHLNTAYSLEAVLDEVVFILGPVLVTFLATSIQPALGLLAAMVLGLGGSLALAAQRGTQPAVRTVADSDAPREPLPVNVLAPIVLACAALGGLFGGMEVVIVSFATEAGILRFAGFLAMAWACGSLIAGVVSGTMDWRTAPATRFRIGALILAVSMLPLPFITNPWLVSALLVLSGLAIAPTLIASVSVTQAAVDPRRLTEALGWTQLGMAGGVALSAAGLGQLIDRWGAQAGFFGMVGIGVLLIVAALTVRTRDVGVRPATPGLVAAPHLEVSPPSQLPPAQLPPEQMIADPDDAASDQR